MRLIDANRLKQNVLDWEDCYNGFSDTYDKARIIDEIDAQPTIEAEPVRHGEWKCVKGPKGADFVFYQCSICGEPRWSREKYCANCGAKMEGAEE